MDNGQIWGHNSVDQYAGFSPSLWERELPSEACTVGISSVAIALEGSLVL